MSNRSMSACEGCAIGPASTLEAGRILRELVEVASLRTLPSGASIIVARISDDQVLRLCLWESECEDCEATGDDCDGSTELQWGDL